MFFDSDSEPPSSYEAVDTRRSTVSLMDEMVFADGYMSRLYLVPFIIFWNRTRR